MTTQNIAIPSVSVINNHAVTTSLAIAGFFGKRHDNIIRSIDNLKPDLDPVFYALNFEEIQNQVDLGMGRARLDRAFNLTKDGFMLLVMGFTGKQAMQFKIAYINRFNEMESALHNPLALTNGQHYVVAKDGVVIYHKVLSDRTAKGYLQPALPPAPKPVLIADFSKKSVFEHKRQYSRYLLSLDVFLDGYGWEGNPLRRLFALLKQAKKDGTTIGVNDIEGAELVFSVTESLARQYKQSLDEISRHASNASDRGCYLPMQGC